MSTTTKNTGTTDHSDPGRLLFGRLEHADGVRDKQAFESKWKDSPSLNPERYAKQWQDAVASAKGKFRSPFGSRTKLKSGVRLLPSPTTHDNNTTNNNSNASSKPKAKAKKKKKSKNKRIINISGKKPLTPDVFGSSSYTPTTATSAYKKERQQQRARSATTPYSKSSSGSGVPRPNTLDPIQQQLFLNQSDSKSAAAAAARFYDAEIDTSTYHEAVRKLMPASPFPSSRVSVSRDTLKKHKDEDGEGEEEEPEEEEEMKLLGLELHTATGMGGGKFIDQGTEEKNNRLYEMLVSLSREESVSGRSLFRLMKEEHGFSGANVDSINALDAKRASVLEKLLSEYEEMRSSFAATIEYCRFRYEEVMQITVGQPPPDKLRVAVCADLLLKIAASGVMSRGIRRYGKLLEPLVIEILSSIYTDPNLPIKVYTSFGRGLFKENIERFDLTKSAREHKTRRRPANIGREQRRRNSVYLNASGNDAQDEEDDVQTPLAPDGLWRMDTHASSKRPVSSYRQRSDLSSLTSPNAPFSRKAHVIVKQTYRRGVPLGLEMAADTNENKQNKQIKKNKKNLQALLDYDYDEVESVADDDDDGDAGDLTTRTDRTDEILASKKPTASVQALRHSSTYYERSKKANAEFHALSRGVIDANKKTTRMQESAQDRVAVLDRTSTNWQLEILSFAFHQWKDTVSVIKQQRRSLGYVLSRLERSEYFAKFRVRKAFNMLRSIIVQKKIASIGPMNKKVVNRGQILDSRVEGLRGEIKNLSKEIDRVMQEDAASNTRMDLLMTVLGQLSEKLMKNSAFRYSSVTKPLLELSMVGLQMLKDKLQKCISTQRRDAHRLFAFLPEQLHPTMKQHYRRLRKVYYGGLDGNESKQDKKKHQQHKQRRGRQAPQQQTNTKDSKGGKQRDRGLLRRRQGRRQSRRDASTSSSRSEMMHVRTLNEDGTRRRTRRSRRMRRGSISSTTSTVLSNAPSMRIQQQQSEEEKKTNKEITTSTPSRLQSKRNSLLKLRGKDGVLGEADEKAAREQEEDVLCEEEEEEEEYTDDDDVKDGFISDSGDELNDNSDEDESSLSDAQKAERLLNSSDQEILLAWINFHLHEFNLFQRTSKYTQMVHSLGGGTSNFRTSEVENFSSDLSNSEALLRVMVQVVPKGLRMSALAALPDIDLESRASKFISLVSQICPYLKDFLTPHYIINCVKPDIVASLLGRLFVENFTIPPLYEPPSPIQQSCHALITQINQFIELTDSHIRRLEENRITGPLQTVHMEHITRYVENTYNHHTIYDKPIDRYADYAPIIPRSSSSRRSSSKVFFPTEESHSARPASRRISTRRRSTRRSTIDTPLDSANDDSGFRRGRARSSSVSPSFGRRSGGGSGRRRSTGSAFASVSSGGSGDGRRQSSTTQQLLDTIKRFDSEETKEQKQRGRRRNSVLTMAALPEDFHSNVNDFSASFEAEWLDSFPSRFADILSEAVSLIHQTDFQTHLWEALEKRMRGFSMTVLHRHVAGNPVPLVDYKVERETMFYSNISEDRLSDVLTCKKPALVTTLSSSPERELEIIREHIKSMYAQLRQIFRSYAADDADTDADTMSILEFTTLAKDCKLITKQFRTDKVEECFYRAALAGRKDADKIIKTLTTQSKQSNARTSLRVPGGPAGLRSGRGGTPRTLVSSPQSPMISLAARHSRRRTPSNTSFGSSASFGPMLASPLTSARKSARGDDNQSGGLGLGPVIPDVEELELGPTRFMELLVRVASLKYKNNKKMGLSERFKTLLKTSILKKAKRLDTEQFRYKLRKAEILQVFRKFRVKLRKIFIYFATSESVTEGDKWSNTLDYKEFMIMLRCAKMCKPEGQLATSEIQLIWNSINKDNFDVARRQSTKTFDVPENVPDRDKRMSMKRMSRRSINIFTGLPVSNSSNSINTLASNNNYNNNDNESIMSGATPRSSMGPSNSPGSTIRRSPSIQSQSLSQMGVSPGVFLPEDMEMIYPEFLESLAALTSYRYPAPYIPLSTRMETFLEREFIPILLRIINKYPDGLSGSRFAPTSSYSNQGDSTARKSARKSAVVDSARRSARLSGRRL